MSKLYDDDYDDYDSVDEAFDEDLLSNEEYDLVYANLPKLKSALAEYNDSIPDDVLKESLYVNEFDLDAVVADMMYSYPAKKKKPALAKARRQASQNDTSDVNKSLEILNRLGDQPATPATAPIPRKLWSKRPTKSDQIAVQPAVVPEPAVSQTPKPQCTSAPDYIKLLSCKIEYDSTKIIDTPKHAISLLLVHSDGPSTKSRCSRKLNKDMFNLITNHEFTADTVQKAASNFKSPSPDDRTEENKKTTVEQGIKKMTLATPAANSTKTLGKADIKNELAKSKIFTKVHKSFVVIGHVDAGKSTLMGRLLLDLNIVDLKTVNRLIKESEKMGKGSFALAWVMDQTSEERARGVTVDICATNFETPTNRFTAIDAPGHRDFVPQMISGVCQADFALLIIDSITGEFESGFQLDGQTKEHTILAKNLGVHKLCCLINKLDKEHWSEDRFNFIKGELTNFLVDEIGFQSGQIDFIPISGLTGNNVVKRDESIVDFAWYKGPKLVDYLENIELPKVDYESLTHEDFNLVINEIEDASNQDFVIRGKVISGLIQTGETVKFSPVEESLRINTISINEKSVNLAFKGEIVDLKFSKKNFKDRLNFENIIVGDIVASVDSSVKSVAKFQCQLTLFNLTKPLLVGTPFVLFRNNFNLPTRLSKIISIDGSKKKKHLVSKQSALVEIEIKSDRLLPIAKFADNEFLGKVVIRREGTTIGAGTVVALE